MTVTASIAFPLKPWTTPNYATVDLPARPKQEGIQQLPSIPLTAIPMDALDSLVAQWRQEVYEKAGTPLPEERTT